MNRFSAYRELYLKRKPRSRSGPRWVDEDLSYFGITPTPFGSWDFVIMPYFSPSSYDLLYARKQWGLPYSQQRYIGNQEKR